MQEASPSYVCISEGNVLLYVNIIVLMRPLIQQGITPCQWKCRAQLAEPYYVRKFPGINFSLSSVYIYG